MPPSPWEQKISRMLKNPFSPRLLKKVQMQGGAPGTHPQDGCRCEAYMVRTPQRRASAPTPQMGLFEQPAKTQAGQHCFPPSTRKTCPVMNEAASETKNATVRAISIGLP